MQDLEQLKRAVFGRQTVLAEIYNKFGRLSLANYVNSWPIAPANSNAEVFINELGLLLQGIYPESVISAVLAQLSNRPLVSTIDHHGLLNHPFFINSNLIFSQNGQTNYLICLTTSGISLNNSSWPGCLLLTASNGRLKRFSFFPDKQKTKAVFTTPPLTRRQLDKVLWEIRQDRVLNPEQKTKLENLVEQLFEGDVLAQTAFSSQASLLSTRLWSKIFPSAPQIIYLPVEKLIAKIICNKIVPNPSHVLHRLFFTAAGWQLAEKAFAGSMGAFSSGHKGSFLFWGVNQKGRRVHLHRDGGKIKDQALINFDLSAASIAQMLSDEKIYPTTLVCFLVLLYYGITCAGGFNQVNWLTDIKLKFLELLEEMGDGEAVQTIQSVPTENFAEGNLASLPNNSRPTGLDLYLTGRDYYQQYQDLARRLSLAESINSLLPDIYNIVVPMGERTDVS